MDLRKLFALFLMLVVPVSAVGAQTSNNATTFTYQGYLENGGVPVNGTCEFQFSLFDVENGGSPLATLPTGGVLVTNGVFSVSLDFGAFNGQDRWLEIAVNDCLGGGIFTTLAPRQVITPAAYATYANSVDWNGINGLPAGFADGVDDDTNTTYGAGTGLNLAGSLFSIEPTYMLPQKCAVNQIAKWDGTGYVCADDVDTNTTYNAGTGLTLSGTTFSITASYRLPQCAILNQVPKWNGSGYTCSTDNNTTYSAGTGLNLTGGVFSIPANTFWEIDGNGSTTGSHFIGTTDNTALNFRANNLRILRLEPNATSPNIIAGYQDNVIGVGVYGATVSGGGELGRANEALANLSTVSGGSANTAGGVRSTVGGGADNKAYSGSATIGGGYLNEASGTASTVGGGQQNTITSGFGSTIPGGYLNEVDADFSMAAGYRAVADDNGSFVWGDSTVAYVSSPATNTFTVRASGGVWLGTTSTPDIPAGRFLNTSTGGYLTTGGVWTNSSDRNAKTNFETVDARAVLEQVAAMPVTRWNYISEGENIDHIGPMAQDFHAAFGLGNDDVSISTIDADGVALAAIQGLNLKLQEEVVALQSQLNLMMLALIGMSLVIFVKLAKR